MEAVINCESKVEVPDTLKRPIAVIHKFGLFSENGQKRIFCAIFFSLFPVFQIIVAFMQLINMKPAISEFVNNFETYVTLGQLFGKILVMAIHQKGFTRLIQKTQYFWSTNECDELTKTELDRLSYMIQRMQQLFVPTMGLAVLFMIATVFFGKDLPVGIWSLEGYDTLYYIVLVLQIPTLTYSTIFVGFFDCMYLAFCVEIIVQLRILCYRLENLTSREDTITEEAGLAQTENITVCLKQHIFLLRFIKEFQNVYSMALMIEYLTGGPLICLELFAAFENHSFQVIFRHIIAYVTVTFQLSIFCVPANYIADEVQKVSNAVYFSNWYSLNSSTFLKPLIILMMQNSQQEITIKASGLVIMNSTTVINLLHSYVNSRLFIWFKIQDNKKASTYQKKHIERKNY